MLFLLFVCLSEKCRYKSFGNKFVDLSVLLAYDHNIMLIRKTESIAKSIGIDYWQYF